MTESDIAKSAKLLGTLKPGFLPYPIFQEIARLVALPIIEFIPLRMNGKKVEVLLIDRGPDDPFWPNALHTPGTVIRATDVHKAGNKNWEAFERIKKDELQGTKTGTLQYVGSQFRKSKRGAEQAQLFWIEVAGEPKVGAFYPVSHLPKEVITGQIPMIKEAARHFVAHYRSM